MNILIPMAGAGTRFEKAGYTFPTPLNDDAGQPMIQTDNENLKLGKCSINFKIDYRRSSEF